MPFINSSVTVKLTDKQKENLKKKMGEIICTIPGKTEDWLFVGFQDEYTLYFKGKLQQKAAVVEVKLLGSISRSLKDSITNKICSAFSDEIGIPQENIYVIFTEVQDGNWGWNGGLF